MFKNEIEYAHFVVYQRFHHFKSTKALVFSMTQYNEVLHFANAKINHHHCQFEREKT